MNATVLSDFGEKKLIRDIIKPLINPDGKKELAGDDCGIIEVLPNHHVCLSTDRVPADLLSLKLGLIDYFELGYYLAVLNISDVVASGAKPAGLLLNLAFPSEFPLQRFRDILDGAKSACEEYGCSIIGGDLSSSAEMSISATSVGLSVNNQLLFRKGAAAGDSIYCSNLIGLTPTAFRYYTEAKPSGMSLDEEEECLLKRQFSKPNAYLALSRSLVACSGTVTAMDNTDGVGQSFLEMAELNGKCYELDKSLLPVHPLCRKVAEFLNIDPIELALSAGADFQLLGTISKQIERDIINEEVRIIGQVKEGSGLWLKDQHQTIPYTEAGWNYFNQR